VNQDYKNSYIEKETRGNIKSAVQRSLDKQIIVIADSTNYIKGFRYELFRVARTVDTTNIVIYCNTPIETSLKWNESLKKWDEKILKELFQRIEEPSESNRWDKPLYIIKPEETLPLKEIEESLAGFKLKPRQEMSELPQTLSDTTLLYELEQISSDIISQIISSQNVLMFGDFITIKGSTEKIKMPKRVNISELRTIRQQFIKYSELHPPPVKEISKLFAIYLNSKLE